MGSLVLLEKLNDEIKHPMIGILEGYIQSHSTQCAQAKPWRSFTKTWMHPREDPGQSPNLTIPLDDFDQAGKDDQIEGLTEKLGR